MIQDKDNQLETKFKNKETIKHLLKNVMKNETDINYINSQLTENHISKKEYNAELLSVLSSTFTGNLEAIEELPETTVMQKGHDIEPNEEDFQCLKNILENYYEINNCPSFLYNRGMLDVKDYSFALQIYSEIFGVQFNNDQMLVEYLKDTFEKYTEELILKCNSTTEPEFLDMLEKL
ncbi:hypothetical protein GINT2_001215 [Glugoides intestinalis]